MNIYLFKWSGVGYDQVREAVVVADNEHTARSMLADYDALHQSGPEYYANYIAGFRGKWAKEHAVLIGTGASGEHAGVICADINES